MGYDKRVAKMPRLMIRFKFIVRLAGAFFTSLSEIFTEFHPG